MTAWRNTWQLQPPNAMEKVITHNPQLHLNPRSSSKQTTL